MIHLILNLKAAASLNATSLTFIANGYCLHKKDGCTIKLRMHTTKGALKVAIFCYFWVVMSQWIIITWELAIRFPQYRGAARDDLKKNFTTPEQMLEELSHIAYKLAHKEIFKVSQQWTSSEIHKSNSVIACEFYKLITCIESGETDQINMIDDKNYKLLEKVPAKSATMHADASGQVVKSIQCCRKIKLHGTNKAFLLHANVWKLENETVLIIRLDNWNVSQFLFNTNDTTPNEVDHRWIITDWSFANFIAILQACNKMCNNLLTIYLLDNMLLSFYEDH